MRKQEFVDRLGSALNGRISPALVTENVRFYENYISTEIQKGRAEEEVLSSLGDPRLIARTIIDTNKVGDAEDAAYRETSYEPVNNDFSRKRQILYKVPKWLWVIGIAAVMVLVIGTVLSILSALAPLLILIALIVFMVKVFKDWLK